MRTCFEKPDEARHAPGSSATMRRREFLGGVASLTAGILAGGCASSASPGAGSVA